MNPPNEKKHNYFYRTTNQINWKYYYGIHSTNDLNDGYLGTGKLIKEAIKKYGKENLILTIIQDYPTRKEASDHERTAVTMIQVNDEMCYNLRTGGDNEFTFIFSEEHRRKLGAAQSGEKHHNFGKHLSEETKEKIRNKTIGRIVSEETRKKMGDRQRGENHHTFGKQPEEMPMFGKTHTDESKNRMSIAHSGNKNHFYGKSHTEETKKLMSEKGIGKPKSEETKAKLRNGSKNKRCVIMDVKYISIAAAARTLKIPESTVRFRVKSESTAYKDWKFDMFPQDSLITMLLEL